MRSPLYCTLALALASTVAIADSQRPDAPDGVQATALSGSSNRVSWNTPFDDVGVDGYNVYRDGSYYTTTGSTTSYVDPNADAGRSYRYSVVAFDAARNYSTVSSDATVTTSASTSTSGTTAATPANRAQPTVPAGLTAQSTGNGVQISWSAASGNVTGYNVYRDSSYYATVKGANSYTDTNTGGSAHSYQVSSFTADSQYSLLSAAVTAGGNTSFSNQDSGSSSIVYNDDAGSAVPGGYSLVFSDEFRGNSVDASKWTSRQRWGPDWIVNSEQQYYVDILNNPGFGYNPFEFDGEHLTIKAIRTPDSLYGSANSQPWVSGVLSTYGKFKMRYGYLEMRAQFPAGQGLWPAFWLLNQNDNDKRPEIDIVELVGRDPNKVFQTYHYYDDYTLRSTPSFEATGSDFSAGFHTYGVKWEPGRIIWYVDGRETNRFEDGNVSWEDMYIIVNLAVGGVWNGNADGNTPSPSQFKIDYIRAYSP